MKKNLGLLGVAAALLVAGAAAAEPKVFRKAGKIRVTCPTSGTSTGKLLGEGDLGRYVLTASNERICVCFGAATCADDEASGSFCLAPGGSIEIRSKAAESFSCWSANGSGLAELVGF